MPQNHADTEYLLGLLCVSWVLLSSYLVFNILNRFLYIDIKIKDQSYYIL